jgi:hypothetical protein
MICGDTHPDTLTDEKDLLRYAIEIGSGAMIYIQSFIKTGSGIQMLMVGGGDIHRHTDRY